MHRFRPSILSLRRNLHQEANFDAAGSFCSRLTTRSVIRFAGPDTIKFLQGLLTNDVQSFEGPPAEMTSTLATPNLPTISVPPMFAALLTPQGRFLYDFFLYRPPRPEEKLDRTGSGPGPSLGSEMELFADVDGSVLDELLDTLRKYRLRSKIEIENVTEDFACWQRYGAKLVENSSSVEEPEAASVGYGGSVQQDAESAACGSDVGWQWFKDPRLNCLGYRGIFRSGVLPPLVEADKEVGVEQYLLWRLEKGVAEGSTEIPKGEAIPLEYNFTGLNAISFDKGCYVGQELIARTHHKGVIRKRLLPLRFIDDDGKELNVKVAPNSEVISTTSKKKVGTINAALGCRGIGVLRLEEAFKGSASLAIGGQEDVKVETIKPVWWPVEWLPGHLQHSAAA